MPKLGLVAAEHALLGFVIAMGKKPYESRVS
jgi:hypothetical protein